MSHLRVSPRGTRVVLVSICSLLFAGCGGSGAGNGAAAAQPKSVEEVASQLRESGLGCLNLRKPPRADWNLGTDNAIGVGECAVAGEDIEIILFSSKGDLDSYFSAAEKIACEFGKAFGITELDFVTSGVWIAEGVSKSVAERIASATGGKAHHVNC